MTKDDDSDRKSHLCVYNLDDRKETVLGDVNNYEITFDGKKMLVKIKKDYAIIDRPKGQARDQRPRATRSTGLDMQLDRHAEWNQIYFECWRQMRDFFLCAEHERRRLEGDARQIRRAGPVRESSQ